MKAIVTGNTSDGESFDYVVEDIINVVYTNEILVFVKNDGQSISYKNAISDGYKYTIAIL